MITINQLRNAVAERLVQLRETLGFGRNRMASELGIQRASYVKKERGGLLPTPEQMHYLATRHKVNLDWLLVGRGSKLYTEPAELKESPVQQEEPGHSAHLLEGTIMSDEYRHLLEEMERLPLLRYELLAYFHRFKKENTELF